MTFLRVLHSVAIALGLVSCSEHARPNGRPPEAGPPSCAAPCDGTCIDGRCLVTLATISLPADIAIDDKSVYFTSCPSNAASGTALSVPLAGGSPATLASGTRCPVSLALMGTSLYVAGLDGTDIASVPREGGAVTSISSSSDQPIGIAASVDHIYWATQAGALMKVALSGGAPTVVASCQERCTRPVVHDSDVYWGDSTAGIIQMAPRDGGTATTIASGLGAVGSMAISGADVYFASDYQLGRAPIDGGVAAGVGLPTGAPVGAICADGSSVYFTSWGSIWKIGFHDIEPTRIAASQGDPNAIVVDDTSVYWTNADAWPDGGCCGQVMKLTPK